MNQQHHFQSQRTDDERHLGSSHTRSQDQTQRPKKTGSGSKPSHDEVAKRAFAIYVNQGCSSGHDVAHWLAAEAELTAIKNVAAGGTTPPPKSLAL